LLNGDGGSLRDRGANLRSGGRPISDDYRNVSMSDGGRELPGVRLLARSAARPRSGRLSRTHWKRSNPM